MSEVNDVLKTVEIDWNGRAWKFGRPNYGTEGAYARHLRRTAVQELDSMLGEISPKAYQAGLAAITDRFAARAYDWGTPLFWDSLASDANFRELLFLILTQPPDQRTLDRKQMERFFAAKGAELLAAWQEVLAPTPPTPPPEGPGASA